MNDAPSTNDAIEMNRFQFANCGAYSTTRRGIPCVPSQCIGKNVALKAMNVSQKWTFPSRSLYIRPVIFGNQ